MTVYFDLNVSSNQGEGKSSPEEMAAVSRILGFSGLGFADFSQGDHQKIRETLSKLPLKAYLRVNLKLDSVTKNKKMLNRVRKYVDIVAAACLNRKIAVWAAKNKDIDLLYFPEVKMCQQVDKSLAGLVYNSENAFEISIRPILLTKGLARANTLGILRKMAEITLRENVTVVLTSGARTKFELRSPRGLVALGALLEIPHKEAIEAVSKNPLKILERRLNSN